MCSCCRRRGVCAGVCAEVAARGCAQVVCELDKEDLALLVQFVTGTSKVPLEGFKALQVCLPPPPS